MDDLQKRTQKIRDIVKYFMLKLSLLQEKHQVEASEFSAKLVKEKIKSIKQSLYSNHDTK